MTEPCGACGAEIGEPCRPMCTGRCCDGDLNIWGTPKGHVGEGYCKDCEREEPHHYASCPVRNPPCQNESKAGHHAV